MYLFLFILFLNNDAIIIFGQVVFNKVFKYVYKYIFCSLVFRIIDIKIFYIKFLSFFVFLNHFDDRFFFYLFIIKSLQVIQ